MTTTPRPRTTMEEALADAGVSLSRTVPKERASRHRYRNNTGAINLERGPYVPLTVPADHPDDPSSPARCELRRRAKAFAGDYQRGDLGPIVHEVLSQWGNHDVTFLFASGSELALTLTPYGPEGASNDRLFWLRGGTSRVKDAPPEAQRAIAEWRLEHDTADQEDTRS